MLELKIPPPLAALTVAAAMFALARHMPSADPEAAWRIPAAALFAVTGAAFDVAGLLAFRKRRTTVNPLHPEKASALVTGGVYRLTRNPMYVGMACFLLAWAAWLGSPLSALGVPVFIGYITQFQIKPEERVLEKLFGDEFRRYEARVRRWL